MKLFSALFGAKSASVTPGLLARYAQETARCSAFLRIVRTDRALDGAALFLKRFRLQIPDFPDHYVAIYSGERGEVVVGYVHMSVRPGFRLCGGLCVDEMSYRRMERAHFQAIREIGGIAKLLMMGSVLDSGEVRATFAYTGDSRSRRIIEEIGFERIVEPYTYALWHGTGLDGVAKTRLTQQVIAEGPF